MDGAMATMSHSDVKCPIGKGSHYYLETWRQEMIHYTSNQVMSHLNFLEVRGRIRPNFGFGIVMFSVSKQLAECCGQSWVWHIFSGRACDGLCGLLTFNDFDWNTIKGFNHPCTFVRRTASRFLTFPALQEVAWSHGQVSKQANTRSFPPVPAFMSIWVVLWLLFFRSAPLRSHKGEATFLEPVSWSPKSLDYTQKSARSILALKLSVAHLFTYGWPPHRGTYAAR